VQAVLLTLCLAANVSFLDERAIFSPPIAHPRSPEMGLDVNLVSFNEFIAVFGGRLPLVNIVAGEQHFQIGLDGSVWSRLGHRPSDNLFPVFSADYLIGVPILWRFRNLSAELIAAHISAHRVDGAAIFNTAPLYRYSVEYLQMRVAYETHLGALWVRPYFTFGTLLHSSSAYVHRGFVGGGFELFGPALGGSAQPFAALDVTYNGDHDFVDSSAEVGFLFAPKVLNVAHVRLGLRAYSGKTREGQSLFERLERFSFGFSVRFADGERR
jgi:Protein of unknown function (DUF1207)